MFLYFDSIYFDSSILTPQTQLLYSKTGLTGVYALLFLCFALRHILWVLVGSVSIGVLMYMNNQYL